jgi:hypothetical protein
MTFSGELLHGGNGRTHASSNIQDRRSVYWYAFTTRKFPSTSHIAKIKSRDRLEDRDREHKLHSHFQPSRSINLSHPANPSVTRGLCDEHSHLRCPLTLVNRVWCVGDEQSEISKAEQLDSRTR